MNTNIKTYSTGEANQKFAQMMRDVQDKGIVLITSNNKPKAVITASGNAEANLRDRNKLISDMKTGILIKTGDELMTVRLVRNDIVIARKYQDIFDEESYDENVYAQIDVNIVCGSGCFFIFTNGLPKQSFSFSADSMENAEVFYDVPGHDALIAKMDRIKADFADPAHMIKRDDVKCICYPEE